MDKRKQEEITKKEMKEKEASIRLLEELLDMLSKPLTALGNDAPPSAFEASESGDVVCVVNGQ